MAIAVSTVISDARALLDDTTVPTAAEILRMLNRGRAELMKETFCVMDECSFSSTQYSHRYALSTSVYKVKNVQFRDVDNWYMVKELTQKQFSTQDLVTTDTIPAGYFEQNKYLYLYPRLSAGAGTDALNGALGSGDTTATLDDTSDFPTVGKVIIDSEVIYYTNKTSTTLTGLVRAQEGTTAASHLDDAVVTERDIIVTYYKFPATSLTTSDNLEEQLSQHSDALVYFMCWQAKLKDSDDVESSADRMAEYYRMKYEEEKDKIRTFVFKSMNSNPTQRDVQFD